MPKRKTKTKAKTKGKGTTTTITKTGGPIRKVTSSKTGRYVPVMGRPPKYNTAVLEIARHCVAKLFMTDEEVCRVISISHTTWYQWRHDHPEFAEATTRAKEVANKTVEASMFKTATGYSVEAVKIFMTDEVTESITKTGKRTITRRQVPVSVGYLEHIPGEFKAQDKWLNNRNPDRWHRKAEDIPVPVLPTADAEERRIAWQKMIQVIKQNAAEGGAPLLSLPAPAEEAKDITPTLATATKKTNGTGNGKA